MTLKKAKTVEEFEQHLVDETKDIVASPWITMSEFGQMMKRLAKEKGKPVVVSTQRKEENPDE